MRRELVEANPAAHAPDLAASLNNLGNRHLESGEPDDNCIAVDQLLDQSLESLPPVTVAWLLGRRAAWHADNSREVAARRALVRAGDLAGRANHEGNEDVDWSGQVRRDLRALVEDLPDDVVRSGRSPDLADWLTAPWPEYAAAEANAWLSARTWDDQETALRGAAHLYTDQGRRELQILNMLYPEIAPDIASLESVLDAIRGSTLEEVLADLAPDARHIDLVVAWLATSTWEESRRLLAVHPELLSDQRTDDVLSAFAASDYSSAATVSQHKAILDLCRRKTLDEAYEVVTDLDAASDTAWDAVARADGDLLDVILAAAPHLLSRAFLAPALASCALLLRPHDTLDDCTSCMAQAAQQGNSTERQALTGRLRHLDRQRPDLHTDVNTLIAVLGSP